MPGWNFTFLHRGRCSDLDMCRQHPPPAQAPLPFPRQEVMGAALPAGAVGWDWLVAQTRPQPPKITQECRSLPAAGMDGYDELLVGIKDIHT